MREPVLLVIAHGSRDPRHAATVHALVGRVRSLRPGLRVETGFLDFNVPSVHGILQSLAAEGVRDVVALPLLLTRAFHAKADIPAVLRQAPPRLRIRQAVLIIAGVDLRCLQDFTRLVRIHRTFGFFPDGSDGGNHDGGEDADDSDDGEKFDQGEGGNACCAVARAADVM